MADLVIPAICDESRRDDINRIIVLQDRSLLAGLHTLDELGLPRALGYLLCDPQNYEALACGFDRGDSPDNINNEVDVRYRLFALRRWIVDDKNPFDLKRGGAPRLTKTVSPTRQERYARKKRKIY